MSGRERTAAERAYGTPGIDLSRWLARQLGRGVTKLRAEGLENLPPGGALLAANHGSYLDGPLLYGVLSRPVTFFIKAEAFVNVVGWYLDRIGQIPVRRGVPERGPLLTALDVLGQGGLVGIFPEGTRRAADTPEAVEVRHGIAYLALRSGKPVVPVACLGTDRVLPRGRAVPRPRQPVVVAVGTPTLVAPEGQRPTRQAIAAAGARVRDLLADHLAATTARLPGPTTTPAAPTTHGPARTGTFGPAAAAAGSYDQNHASTPPAPAGQADH